MIIIFLPLYYIYYVHFGNWTTIKDFTNLLHNPKAFFIGIFNQMVILPIVVSIILLIEITKELAVEL